MRNARLNSASISRSTCCLQQAYNTRIAPESSELEMRNARVVIDQSTAREVREPLESIPLS